MKSFTTKFPSQRQANLAFLLGFVIVVVTYFVASEQFVFHAPKAPPKSTPAYAAKADIIKEKDSKVSSHLVIRSNGKVAEVKVEVGQTEETDQQERDSPADLTTSLQQQQQKETTDLKQFGGKADADSRITNQAHGTKVKADVVSRTSNQAHGTKDNKPLCRVDHPVSDTCNITGDIRVHGATKTVLVVPPKPTKGGFGEQQEWKIRPYSRKHLAVTKEVTVKRLESPEIAPACSTRSDIPAIVFSVVGFTGNYWHDFSDVLVPLFIASRQFDGQVQFLVSHIQAWWLFKYDIILRRLTRYNIIDFDKDESVRCFPHVLIGLQMHKEFNIDPSIAPNGYSMADFTKFLREAYGLKRDLAVQLVTKSSQEVKPRMLLIARNHNRKFVNAPDIVQLAEKLGFEVSIDDPKFSTNIAKMARKVNGFDVLVGVHGAGLTNSVFLPSRAVLIQVVPYGKLDPMARGDFGEPARDMGLKYLEYSVTTEESTLSEMLGKEHPAIKDPESIHRQGWEKVAKLYLMMQDVRINLSRFTPILVQALNHLKNWNTSDIN